jgi:glucose-1-phosphate cytidylyltransferase
MKAVILAGGLGTRISEESNVRPKPMIEIGGFPIIWHIMKIYSFYGINDFIICCGYKGYVIKEYFANYFLHNSDITINIKENSIAVHNKKTEPWSITLIDTGESTQTGGRLKRISAHIDGAFCMTYGDGLSNINISNLIKFHKQHKNLATMTAVQPPGRFGAIEIIDTKIISFSEKPKGDGGWVNGGFFILEPGVLSYIKDDADILEKGPLESLAKNGELHAFFHSEFWHPMDTLRDKNYLENLWLSNLAPWKLWA